MAECPSWYADATTAPDAALLGRLKDGENLQEAMSPDCLRAVLKAAKSNGAPWLYSFLYDKIRSDLGLSSCFDDFLKSNKGALEQLNLKDVKPEAADKVAWLHSHIIGHLSDHFNEDEVHAFVDGLKESRCSHLGKVEVITNLLKSTNFRNAVWSREDVQSIILEDTDQPNEMYKVVFAFWMLTYDSKCMEALSGKAAKKLKKFLTSETKVEKVVRLSLEVLQRFLKSKALTEDLASESLLEVVQSLGYEKWRDNELYEHIRALGQAIQSAVSEVSNYERYMKEVRSRTLTKGYLHSAKFWAENFSKFTEADVKELTNLLESGADNQAIICFDLGELAVLHREGKKWIAASGAKDKVMSFLSNNGGSREVRREALLCCQKIMLKWQEVPLK